jgi:DNA-binding NarL/FixJ family response regulator
VHTFLPCVLANGEKIDSQERNCLIAFHRKERNSRIRDRIKAVLAYNDGYNYSDIARLLLLDNETVRQHIKDDFLQEKLKPENAGSSRKKLTDEKDEKTAKLIVHLEEKRYLYRAKDCSAQSKIVA